MSTSKSTTSMYLVIGLMLFALFFGAGNLIYPAFLGLYAGSNVTMATIGFILTAVTLPLLGVVALAYTGTDDAESLARPVSKGYGVFFSVLLYLSIGPFFAGPRTGAMSYSMGVVPIFGDNLTNKIIYAIIFFGLSYLLAVRPSKLADAIGKYLTPTLLFVLAVLVVASFVNPAGQAGMPLNSGNGVNNAFAEVPFVAGVIQGYGTLDALAALAFSILVVQSAKSFGVTDNKAIAGITIKSGVIASVILALIYIFVSRIGATSQSLFELVDGTFLFQGNPVDGGIILSQASRHYLGAVGQAVLALVVFLACLTTSVGLITACANYFHKLVPKVSHLVWATLFTTMTTAFYFGGLSEIIKWSVPALYFLYPLTVAIILLGLAQKLFNNAPIVYRTTIAMTFVAALYDGLSTFAGMTAAFEIPKAISHFFTEIVPLGAYSMGWIPFAAVGFVIGFVISKVQK